MRPDVVTGKCYAIIRKILGILLHLRVLDVYFKWLNATVHI